MDPKILNERVRSLSNMTKLQNGVMIGVGAMTVTAVVSLIAMFYLTTTNLSELNYTTASLENVFKTKFEDLDEKFESLDEKFEGLNVKFEDLEAKVDGLELKFDAEFAASKS